MGCQCLTNDKEIDVNYQRDGKVFTKSEDGIKLKAGPRKRTSPRLRSKASNYLGDLTNYRREVLDCIDQHRRDHGVSPLRMNTEINTIAQRFAEQLAAINELDFSENTFQGESLGESVYESFKKLSADKLVDKWYEEIRDYNFKDNDPEPSHFSQMVWKSSTDFGLGVAVGSKGHFFYVANYYPTGNISGYFTMNVFPKKGLGGNNSNISSNVKVTKNSSGGTTTQKVTYTNFGNADLNDLNKMGFNDFFNEFNNFNNKFNNDFANFGNDFSNDFNNNTTNKKQTKKTVINRQYQDDYNNNNNYNYNNNSSSNNNQSKVDPASGATTGNFNTFCIECLQAHNKYRSRHHVPALRLNKELCNIAQAYAEKLAKANMMQHSGNTYKGEELGENVYMCGGIQATGKSVTDSWYNEVKIYDYNGDYQSGTGHFTQVVWKGSTECGFGMGTNGRGAYYVVGNYYPAGNFIGCFKSNVLRP